MKIKYGRNNAEGGNVLNSDFCVAVHGLVFLKHKGCTISSEELAENICTNPARVRKVMAKLTACDKLGLPRDNAFMNSTLGRVYGRALDALINVDMMVDQLQEMTDRIRNGETSTFNPEKWEPETWPSSCKGVGWVEAPRGSLSHWVRIENGQTANYQAVVPSTWNSSGRDAAGQMGPYEYSLAHTGKHPLVDPSRPVEPLRTIHSYDPCQSCAVHLFDEEGEAILTRQDP